MIEDLLIYQANLLKNLPTKWQRFLYFQLPENERLLGIKGLRGVGKSTLLLQLLSKKLAEGKKAMYVTVEHPYFYKNSLFELVSTWYSFGGRYFFIDEIHKYPNWSRELKLIYDGFPDLKVFFTSSSALDLYKGESDLSRRLAVEVLPGLSFREFLEFNNYQSLSKLNLEELINHPLEISQSIFTQLEQPILPLFKEYLQTGYFPLTLEYSSEQILQRLIRIINAVLESDLAQIQSFSADNLIKIKQLLGVIAESVPFEPNISKLAEKMRLGRQTINIYLKNLEDAKILKLLYEKSTGISLLQKPGKIYFENSNFLFSFQGSPSIGTIRETFFLNQLNNAGHRLSLAKKGDFVVNDEFTFEVGGKNKENIQIKGIDKAYLAIDDIEISFGQKIPLWLFGFLY
ncbi:ATP-binding protein [Algoriphagus confluentis]|uniref:AAA family ATPase n=1 Tax=Algoriphagus confluentis TaxID=1697556 RepID=A0ABQ6PKZ0_9BACT|nr:AAA family ATPase [Algoriphagus confluentis]